jgi:DNA topoisomerase IB
MTRLRRSDCSGPGISRRGRGRGFEYRAHDGRRVDDAEVLARIRELGIPPAWKDVWICPSPAGHLQATGTDAAGRKQYLYHPQWRVRRDAEKFADMARFAHALPDLRAHVQDDLDGDSFTRARVLACAVRLLDRGFFRIVHAPPVVGAVLEAAAAPAAGDAGAGAVGSAQSCHVPQSLPAHRRFTLGRGDGQPGLRNHS